MLTERAEQEQIHAKAKAKIVSINQDITLLARPLLDAALKKKDKIHGTADFAADGEIYKGEIDASVSWDQKLLMAALKTIKKPLEQDTIKIKLEVGEKVFKDLPDGPLKTAIAAARTVKYSDPKVSKI